MIALLKENQPRASMALRLTQTIENVPMDCHHFSGTINDLLAGEIKRGNKSLANVQVLNFLLTLTCA